MTKANSKHFSENISQCSMVTREQNMSESVNSKRNRECTSKEKKAIDTRTHIIQELQENTTTNKAEAIDKSRTHKSATGSIDRRTAPRLGKQTRLLPPLPKSHKGRENKQA